MTPRCDLEQRLELRAAERVWARGIAQAEPEPVAHVVAPDGKVCACVTRGHLRAYAALQRERARRGGWQIEQGIIGPEWQGKVDECLNEADRVDAALERDTVPAKLVAGVWCSRFEDVVEPDDVLMLTAPRVVVAPRQLAVPLVKPRPAASRLRVRRKHGRRVRTSRRARAPGREDDPEPDDRVARHPPAGLRR